MVKQVTINDQSGSFLAFAYCAELDGSSILCFQSEEDAYSYEDYLARKATFSPAQRAGLQAAMRRSEDFLLGTLDICHQSQKTALKQKAQHLHALIQESV